MAKQLQLRASVIPATSHAAAVELRMAATLKQEVFDHVHRFLL